MPTSQQRCISCGYLMDCPGPSVCFTCILTKAKREMSIGLAPPHTKEVSKSAIHDSRKSFQPSSITRPKQVRQDEIAKSKAERRKSSKLESLNEARIAFRKSQALPQRLREERLELSTNIVCVLCGVSVKKGTLLEHKQQVHGEKIANVKIKKSPKKANTWVTIVSGGLPSLGKKR